MVKSRIAETVGEYANSLTLQRKGECTTIGGIHQPILCVRSAKLVPDLRALCATAKQHLSGVADFYYKLGRHREREYDCRRKKHRLIHTLARK